MLRRPLVKETCEIKERLQGLDTITDKTEILVRQNSGLEWGLSIVTGPNSRTRHQSLALACSRSYSSLYTLLFVRPTCAPTIPLATGVRGRPPPGFWHHDDQKYLQHKHTSRIRRMLQPSRIAEQLAISVEVLAHNLSQVFLILWQIIVFLFHTQSLLLREYTPESYLG